MDLASCSIGTVKLENSDEFIFNGDEDDVNRCCVFLCELKNKIKTEYPSNEEEDINLKNKEEENVIIPLTPKKEIEDEEDLEVEMKVSHFLESPDVDVKIISKREEEKQSKKSVCKFKCNLCSASFRYKSSFSYHMESGCQRGLIFGPESLVKSSGSTMCHICLKRFSSRSNLMVHLRLHTGEKPFKCSQCGQAFTQNAHLKEHITRMHTEGKIFLCRICNKPFPDRRSLRKHSVEHESWRGFKCRECSRWFPTVERLQSHTRHESKPKLCPLCGTVCQSRIAFKSHLATHPPPLRCPLCDQPFPSLPSWRQHVKSQHRGSRKCGYCDRTFYSDYNLWVHERSHTEDRPFPCEFCCSAFASKSNLDIHRALHTGQRDFVCYQCGMAFDIKSELDVHIATHLHTALHCQVCNKTFKCKEYLKNHMKTHRRQEEVGSAATQHPFPMNEEFFQATLKQDSRVLPDETPSLNIKQEPVV